MTEPYELGWRLKGRNFSVSEKFQAVSFYDGKDHFGTAKLSEKGHSVIGTNFETRSFHYRITSRKEDHKN